MPNLSRPGPNAWRGLKVAFHGAVALFADLQTLPEGFLYQPDFVPPDEQRALLDEIRTLEFHDVRMHGVVARRRVIQYGWKYAFDGARRS